MQIYCPHCHHLGTTRPNALLGRLYVCDRCHLMLRLADHVPNRYQWQPFTPQGGENRQEMNAKGEDNA